MKPLRIASAAASILVLTACGTGGGGAPSGGGTPSGPSEVQRVDTTAAGLGGNGYARGARLSANDRWVVFSSFADDLVSGPANTTEQIYLKDLQTGAIRILSRTSGALGNGPSTDPAISADGRWVVFASAATNLVPADTDGNAAVDIFLVDTQQANLDLAITRVNRSVAAATPGGEANAASAMPDISRDGAWIAFQSAATNLVDGDTHGQVQIYRRHRATNDLQVMSIGLSGGIFGPGTGTSRTPRLADDSARTGESGAVFYATTTANDPDDTNGIEDIYMSFGGGTTRRSIPYAIGHDTDGASNWPWPSADARFVAFRSDASNLLAPSTGSRPSPAIYLYDRQSLSTEYVSRGSGTAPVLAAADQPSVSDDGRFVGFRSASAALVAGDTNGKLDLFVLDRAALRTTRVSVTATGGQNDADVREGAISADGSRCVFVTTGTVFGASDGNAHVYVARLPPLGSG